MNSPARAAYEEALAIYQQFAKAAPDAYNKYVKLANKHVKLAQDSLESMPK